jgi:hypothetical protein
MVVECLLYLLAKENWRIVVVANIPRVESQHMLSLVAEDLITAAGPVGTLRHKHPLQADGPAF